MISKVDIFDFAVCELEFINLDAEILYIFNDYCHNCGDESTFIIFKEHEGCIDYLKTCRVSNEKGEWPWVTGYEFRVKDKDRYMHQILKQRYPVKENKP